VLFEGTTISEGRGTDHPFEWLGAPWLDGTAWAAAVNGAAPTGVHVEPASRRPDSSKFAGQQCQGVLIQITDRQQVRPMQLGVELLAAARALVPERVQLTPSTFDGLAGTDQLRRALEAGRPVAEIVAAWQPALDAFAARRERYLLY
jgi:uncharacterized protein YbbC (DUF1343 family)